VIPEDIGGHERGAFSIARGGESVPANPVEKMEVGSRLASAANPSLPVRSVPERKRSRDVQHRRALLFSSKRAGRRSRQ